MFFIGVLCFGNPATELAGVLQRLPVPCFHVVSDQRLGLVLLVAHQAPPHAALPRVQLPPHQVPQHAVTEIPRACATSVECVLREETVICQGT